jgi:RNA polymerase sigma-70 factor (ECF subfamily)
VSRESDLEWTRDIALTALLGAVLRECAREPLTLLTDVGDASLIRIGRADQRAPEPFDELLLDAYESASEMLLAYATREMRNRTDAEDIVQTAFMRVFARRPEGITDAEALRKYLWRTAKNLIADARTRAARDRERLDPDGVPVCRSTTW